MRSRTHVTVLLFALLGLVSAIGCRSNTTPLKTLLDDPSFYDKKIVRVSGTVGSSMGVIAMAPTRSTTVPPSSWWCPRRTGRRARGEGRRRGRVPLGRSRSEPPRPRCWWRSALPTVDGPDPKGDFRARSVTPSVRARSLRRAPSQLGGGAIDLGHERPRSQRTRRGPEVPSIAIDSANRRPPRADPAPPGGRSCSRRTGRSADRRRCRARPPMARVRRPACGAPSMPRCPVVAAGHRRERTIQGPPPGRGHAPVHHSGSSGAPHAPTQRRRDAIEAQTRSDHAPPRSGSPRPAHA